MAFLADSRPKKKLRLPRSKGWRTSICCFARTCYPPTNIPHQLAGSIENLGLFGKKHQAVEGGLKEAESSWDILEARAQEHFSKSRMIQGYCIEGLECSS